MSQFAIGSLTKFQFNLPTRPMLARDADSVYWMARYIERAEHVARILWVNSNLLVDVGDLAPALQDRQWESVLTIFHAGRPEKTPGSIAVWMRQFMTFAHENPNSIVTCLTRARENARGVRELISSEMWENLNALYWSLQGDDAPRQFEESHDDFFRSIMTGSLMFQGLTDQTIAHDQRWLFAQLGKYLERITVTCRVIETKFNILHQAEAMLEAPLRNIPLDGGAAKLLQHRGVPPESRRRHGPAESRRIFTAGKQLPPQRSLRGASRPRIDQPACEPGDQPPP